MDVNNLPSVSSATKSTLCIQQKNNSNESSKNAKFALKISETVPSSNQDSDRSATVAAAAKKEAHKKQFIASQATVSMMQPLIFRR
ncbi:Hypothetical protein PHPALM_3815 [Phytophthora palmivora]|uniref:Uncharacterized protein n=1 Tax=Phytophthora palmivora TaxID=4796 RepID=A0A2P4YLE7_9STRA|nr:Hypothetical protein PHPALM_3815 [Phytophthora palmivora]